MKKISILFITLALLVLSSTTMGQTLEVKQSFRLIPASSVTAMYKNQFGRWEKPLLDDTFPYSVIRVVLEGNEKEVLAAMEKIGLYLGTQRMVLDKSTEIENEILFLIPSGAGHVEIMCGNGCEKQTIIDVPRLNSNQVYYGKVHYIPAEEESQSAEAVNLDALKQQLLAELTEYMQDQKAQNAQISQQPIQAPEPVVEDIEYEYVDMGLSVKWATCNVGATKPEELGTYFAWGEKNTKDIYNWSTYAHYDSDKSVLTKYCTRTRSGKVDNKIIIDYADDVVYVEREDNCRMPTAQEMNELCEKCAWVWMEKNGVAGYKVISNITGKSIFLPAAGFMYNDRLYSTKTDGYYWSSSVNTQYPEEAYGVHFNANSVSRSNDYRYYGRSIRPVKP